METNHPQQESVAPGSDCEVEFGGSVHVNIAPEEIEKIRGIFLSINKPNDKSAKPYLMHDMALANALLGKSTLTNIGAAFKKHHATIIFYRKNHDGNMRFWKGYSEMFDSANVVVKGYLDYHGSVALEERAERIESTIAFLTKRLELIRSDIERANRLAKLPKQHQNP